MNVLEIDRGNTLLKWRITAGGQTVHEGCEATRSGFNALLARVASFRPGYVCLANVAERESEPQFIEECAKRWDADVFVAESTAMAAGVRNGYADPAQLGVDRWLALVAARNAYPDRPLCVIDCGTAFTADFMDSSGQHLGGYIAPGRSTMFACLNEGGARVPALTAPPGPGNAEPGLATGEALVGGVHWMVRGLLDHCARHPRTDGLLVCTGGDAMFALACLRDEALERTRHHHTLVLDGLRHLAPRVG